jgi:hypothetical protein
MTCKNCDNNFEGKFCNQCGQPAATHDMNFHFLVHDVQHGLLHLDKGFFYTVKELFKRPGHAIREYIKGKRVNYFKPISLILVLAGTYGLLSHFFHIDILSDSVNVNTSEKGGEEIKKAYLEMSEWVSGHYSLVSLLTLPIFALGTFIGFRKQGYNFVEHLVLNAYLTGQRLVLHVVFFPILLLSSKVGSQKNAGDFLSLIIAAITLWTMFQFFDSLKKWSVFWRTTLSFVIAGIIYLAIGITILINVLPDFEGK